MTVLEKGIANWVVRYDVIGSQTSQEDRFECTVSVSVAAVDGDSGAEAKRAGNG